MAGQTTPASAQTCDICTVCVCHNAVCLQLWCCQQTALPCSCTAGRSGLGCLAGSTNGSSRVAQRCNVNEHQQGQKDVCSQKHDSSVITNSAYRADSKHAFTKSTCNAEQPGMHALLWAYKSDSNACAEAMLRHTTNSKTTYRMAVVSHAADHLVDQQEANTT